MLALLNHISTPMVFLGGVVIIALNMLFLRWFLGKIQSEPADELEAEDPAAEAAADATTGVGALARVTTAGTPRSKPIQPVTPPASGSSPSSPIRLTNLAEGSSPAASIAPASAPEQSSAKIEMPAATSPASVKSSEPISLTRSATGSTPTASLSQLYSDKPKGAAETPAAASTKSTEPAKSPLFDTPEKASAPGKSQEKSSILPPLSFTRRIPAERPPGADLIAATTAKTPEPAKPAASSPSPSSSSSSFNPFNVGAKPPAADLIMVEKPAESVKPEEPAPKEELKTAAKTPEASKPAGADLIAITPEKAAAPAETKPSIPDKASGGETPAGAVGGGLMLIPSSPEASPVAPEANKPAATPAAAPSSWKTRLLGRPRIFLPTGGTPAAEAPSEAATPASGEKLDPAYEPLPTKEEAPSAPVMKSEEKSALSEPAASSKQPEAPIEKPVEKPTPVEQSKTIPSVDLAPVTNAKAATEPEAKADHKPEKTSAVETPAPAKTPEAAITPAPAKEGPGKSPEPSAAAATAVIAPAASNLPAAPAAAPATSAEKPPEKAASASTTPAPIKPVMSQKEPTATTTGGRASAQITIGFEITSLQLTPFFKLGAVQLRSLSNIVSLHLVASQQAENPLAAGISFQIDAVDLDDSSHIKSILLKPLGQSQPTATPQPRLQVENVKIGAGNEGAIEITSSQQTSTAVQLLATCTIAAMEFTPAFEIGSLRLEPNNNTVMLRLAPSSRPAALDLPPAFEVASVQLEGAAQFSNVRLVPSGSK